MRCSSHPHHNSRRFIIARIESEGLFQVQCGYCAYLHVKTDFGCTPKKIEEIILNQHRHHKFRQKDVQKRNANFYLFQKEVRRWDQHCEFL